VVWFKRDSRIPHHAPLSQPAARGPVLPLFIAEPGLYSEPDAAARHWCFARECLEGLRQDLARLGQPLLVRTGDAVAILRHLNAGFGIDALWSHEETGNAWTYARDRRVAAWAREAGIPWHELRQFGVERRLDKRDGWAARWDRMMGEPSSTPPPALPPLGLSDGELGALPEPAQLSLAADSCPGRQTGGRKAALATLDSFLAARGHNYRREMSSPLTAQTSCSRLSPHLAWGTLSIRETAQATYARMQDLKSDPQTPELKAFRASLTSFAGRLHWHCHFIQKLETEPRLEFENLHRAYDGLRPQTPDSERLGAWCRGETGLPMVDACMRSLHRTGWLNFRMRAMLMAVASYHLWLPWRDTGLFLARQFTDYEPGIHWPQTQMQSGTTGINTVRIYNPIKQGYDHDPTGRFIRENLPELGAVPDDFIHEPWKWDGFATEIVDRYPHPIVDHVRAAREARDRIHAVRKGASYRDHADAIQDRHGSRKSGMRFTGAKSRARRTTRARAGADSGQLDLDL